MIKVKIINQSGNLLPKYETIHSAGVDLRAALLQPEFIVPGERKLIPTGIFMELPAGYEAQIRPRSGLAFKHGVTVLNSPGTIDADYRGEVMVLLINLGSHPFEVQNGDRIAQMIICPFSQVIWELTNELGETERGAGGYGHTGKK